MPADGMSAAAKNGTSARPTRQLYYQATLAAGLPTKKKVDALPDVLMALARGSVELPRRKMALVSV
jgi:hypothetical protein